MIKFIHFSDTHLGLKMTNRSFGVDYAQERRRQIWNTLKAAIEYTVENNIDFIFIPGDVYEDEYFTIGDGERLRDIFCINKDVNILIAAGNHDYISKNSIYSQIKWPNNVYIFDDKKLDKIDFPDKNISIFGMSWDKIEKKEELILREEYFKTDLKYKVLLLHSGLDYDSGYLPINLESLKSFGLDYVALGHIHKRQKLADNIYYSGCLEPTHFKETGRKGFIEGVLDDDLYIKFIPFARREFSILDITINEDLTYNDIYNLFSEISGRDNNFYRINLKGFINNNVDKEMLFKDIKENFFYLEIIDQTVMDYDLEKLKKDYKGRLVEQFIEQMQEKSLTNPIVKDALYIGLEALLKE